MVSLLNITTLKFTHPDYASLVDPLSCAKRVRNKFKISINKKPSFRLRREGGQAQQRPGESAALQIGFIRRSS